MKTQEMTLSCAGPFGRCPSLIATAVIVFLSWPQLTAAQNSTRNHILEAVEREKRRPLIVNVFATWCEPCQSEMPLISQMERYWAARGVSFLGISIDDETTVGRLPEFIDQFALKFPIVKKAERRDLRELGLHGVIPDTLLFLNLERPTSYVEGIITREELISFAQYGLHPAGVSPSNKFRP